jgi:hypothetical protein
LVEVFIVVGCLINGFAALRPANSGSRILEFTQTPSLAHGKAFGV